MYNGCGEKAMLNYECANYELLIMYYEDKGHYLLEIRSELIEKK